MKITQSLITMEMETAEFKMIKEAVKANLRNAEARFSFYANKEPGKMTNMEWHFKEVAEVELQKARKTMSLFDN